MMKNRISRRNLLRGSGVCLALPWLETLLPSARAQTAAPLRFIPMFVPNGVPEDYYRPTGEGTGAAWQLSALLEPFAAVKEKMIVLTNVENYTALSGQPTNDPSHSRCTGAFLTCVDSDAVAGGGQGPINGVSIDQVIAQQLNTPTAFKSMQFGLPGFGSPDARDYSLSRSISWADERTPLYKDVNPMVIFDKLMGLQATAPDPGTGNMEPEVDMQAQTLAALKRSKLDYLFDSATKLKAKLSYSDRIKLDQYLTGARALEERAALIGGGMVSAGFGCASYTAPTLDYGDLAPANGPTYDRGAHADVMIDLVTMAIECDATRIISFMLDDERSEFVYSHIPARTFSGSTSTEGTEPQGGLYHELQHAGPSNDGFATVTRWLLSLSARLAERLDGIEDVDGSTVLDNTAIFVSGAMRGSDHSGHELPMSLIGGGSVLTTNQHIVFPATPNNRPLRDLYLTIANGYFGLNIADFGLSKTGASIQMMNEIL